MSDPERFEYTSVNAQIAEAGFLPQLPLHLTCENQSVTASGLLDTGATVNVLPYRVGLQLGAKWDPQAPAITLTGNLSQFPARPNRRIGFCWKLPADAFSFCLDTS